MHCIGCMLINQRVSPTFLYHRKSEKVQYTLSNEHVIGQFYLLIDFKINPITTNITLPIHDNYTIRFYYIRWIVVVCCFQQFLVFIGYLSESVAATQIAWNTWIPTALFCLTILSIRLSESYIQIRSLAFQINKKHIYIAYTSWICASIFDWTGTICGFAFDAHIPQAFFYATWKLLAAICLSVVAWIVWQVRNATKNVYNHQLRRESLDVRYKPKSTNIGEDILDSIKSTKLSLQKSFSARKLSKKNSHHKANSVSKPDTERMSPSSNDMEDEHEEQQDLNPQTIATPERAPGIYYID